ncbi:MAG: hypothetical protein VYA30_06260, partial [Myxococcota bacterium]|nr:hypothetical protein [Myxococcota bacterium]
RSVERPLHLLSLIDDIDAPVPGITVYGPCGSDSCLENQGVISAVREAFIPQMAQWPMGERFADVSFVPVLNEFTLQESIAPTLFAFGYLAELDGGQRAGEQSGMGGDGGSGAGGGGGSSGMGGSAGGSGGTGGTMGSAGGSSGAGGTAGSRPVDTDGGVLNDGDVDNLNDGGVASGTSSGSSGCAVASDEQGAVMAFIFLLAIGALRRKRCHTGY